MKIIGIIGTRSRDTDADKDLVRQAMINLYQEGDTLVSGGCPQGGDRFAQEIAIVELHLGYTRLIEAAQPEPGRMNVHPALWNKYGRSAGFNRNTYIARDAEWLIACASPKRTGGTEDTIKKFLAKGPEFKERLILV